MKPFKIAVSASLLSLCLAAPAFAQFNNEISNFAPAGAAGPEDREYYFRVPEGVEVVTRKGDVIKGGETIGIPGHFLTVLAPDKAEPMIKSQFGFENKNQPVAQMTEADRRKYAVVAIQIPEGASVRTDDGKRVVKGPNTVYILALAESMFALEKGKWKAEYERAKGPLALESIREYEYWNPKWYDWNSGMLPPYLYEKELKYNKELAPATRQLRLASIFCEIKVFYATDRMQSNEEVNSPNFFYSGNRNKTGTFNFGVTKVSIPHDHRMGELERPRWWKFEFRENPVKHVVLLSIEIFSETEFKNQLRQQMEEMSRRSVLVFVHGYNTTFQDGILRTAQIAYDLQFPGVPILYSWPSNGEIDDYISDEANAEWTTLHFKAFLTLVLTETGAQTVNVIAHSMGNRALINALRDFDVKGLPPNAASLHNVVFAAPDFDAGTFTELAQQFKKKANRVTLYASSNDEALKYSSKIHGYSRAGYSGDDIVVINGIDTIDASAVATDFIGHAYFGERRSIISDIFHLITNDLPPKYRHGLEQKIKNGKQYWALMP